MIRITDERREKDLEKYFISADRKRRATILFQMPEYLVDDFQYRLERATNKQLFMEILASLSVRKSLLDKSPLTPKVIRRAYYRAEVEALSAIAKNKKLFSEILDKESSRRLAKGMRPFSTKMIKAAFEEVERVSRRGRSR